MPDLIRMCGPANLDLVYNFSDAFPPGLLLVLFLPRLGLTGVKPEERIHHPLVLIQRLRPVV